MLNVESWRKGTLVRKLHGFFTNEREMLQVFL